MFVSPILAKRYTDAELRATFMKMPPPEYPFEARSHHHTGSGLFRLIVDERGAVTSVDVLKSTGHPELDYCSVSGFRRWYARPGARREVDVPVTFTLGGATSGPGDDGEVIRELRKEQGRH